MTKANRDEINDSIKLLEGYRDRLKKEVLTISRKLHLSDGKIENTLRQHPQIKEIDETINALIRQRELSDSSQE